MDGWAASCSTKGKHAFKTFIKMFTYRSSLINPFSPFPPSSLERSPSPPTRRADGLSVDREVGDLWASWGMCIAEMVEEDGLDGMMMVSTYTTHSLRRSLTSISTSNLHPPASKSLSPHCPAQRTSIRRVEMCSAARFGATMRSISITSTARQHDAQLASFRYVVSTRWRVVGGLMDGEG